MVSLGKKIEKGQKISLTKPSEGVSSGRNLQVGLKWNSNTDVDASVICLDAQNRLEDLVYFGSKKSKDGSIVHLGDDTTGHNISGLDNDNETIKVNLDKVSPKIEKLLFIANIYDGPKRNQTFKNIGMATIRIINVEAKDVMVTYSLDGKNDVNAAIIGEMYRRPNNEWNFQAIGEELFLKSGRMGELVSAKGYQ